MASKKPQTITAAVRRGAAGMPKLPAQFTPSAQAQSGFPDMEMAGTGKRPDPMGGMGPTMGGPMGAPDPTFTPSFGSGSPGPMGGIGSPMGGTAGGVGTPPLMGSTKPKFGEPGYSSPWFSGDPAGLKTWASRASLDPRIKTAIMAGKVSGPSVSHMGRPEYDPGLGMAYFTGRSK